MMWACLGAFVLFQLVVALAIVVEVRAPKCPQCGAPRSSTAEAVVDSAFDDDPPGLDSPRPPKGEP